MDIPAGLQGEARTRVSPENTAAAVGSGALPVFGTPYMVALMEKAAMESVQPYLEPGKGTVGTRLDISHDAATPLGMEVRAVSTLTAVEGRKLSFRVEAFDETGPIGGGTHERFVIDEQRFMDKCTAKLSR